MLYFAQFIVTNINEDAREAGPSSGPKREMQMRMQRLDGDISDTVTKLETQLDSELTGIESEEEGRFAFSMTASMTRHRR